MYKDKFNLSGKVALITGGNRGLGESMTVALAEAGADIAVACRSRADRVGDTVRSLGRGFLHVQADLSDLNCIEDLVTAVIKQYNRIDILVNNAGITRRMPALEYTVDTWKSIINLNLDSVFFLCQRVAMEFIRQGSGGKIISVASIVSFQGGLNNTPYTASKSALAGITKTMSNEWAQYGINVNAIAPGFMHTDLTDEVFQNADRHKQIIARIPQGRWGTPEDVGGAVLFLASAAADYINGATLPIDGGWLGN